MSIRAIVTGSTGMVGEGVLYECLKNPTVEAVLVINRKPCGVNHPKLKEIIHSNFFDFSAIESQLSGYNACYFCLGVSSVGVSKEDYERFTYQLTMHVATTLAKLNPDMTFCYVSGSRTDSTEKGSIRWARVKGKTENSLMKLPFKQAFMFRPGYIHPAPGMKNTQKGYKYITWMYPLLKAISTNYACKLEDIGRAMIRVTLSGYEKQILEVPDIIKASQSL
ncbi:MAG TPA: NAD-dependent epimerase/dehydratase family protein [Chitinophagales bacterium]|nr:NAD-dependent epimerase/dehydratase family protein [Chitinophagales bacterium]